MSDTITEKATEKAKGAGEKAKDAGESITSDGDSGDSVAKRLLIPAAAGIATLAVTYGASKAPSLVRERLLPRLEEKGGEEAAEMGKEAASKLAEDGGPMGAIAGKAAGMLGRGGGGGGGKREKTRRLPIQRWTDVAVSVETAYEKWTEFEEFPKFMHRVLSVQEDGDDRLSWEEKIWFSKRRWTGEIVERKENDRLVWKTVEGTSHTGVVSFHRLDRQLTRVMVTVDFHPTGMMEKMASGLRFVKRAVQADLARFKAYAELADVEGVEYTQAATTGGDEESEQDENSEQDPKNEQDEKDEQDDQDDQDERGEESANGSSANASSNGHGDPAEVESSRRERAERREQRRS